MKILISTLLLTLSMPLMAESAHKTSAPLKAVVEQFNLEEQMITLHGHDYIFAKNIEILNKQNVHVGFSGLNNGQVVEFDSTDSNQDAIRKDVNNHKTVTFIKIISDNRKNDEVD